MEKFFNNLEKPREYFKEILWDIGYIVFSLYLTICLIGELGTSWWTVIFLIIMFSWFVANVSYLIIDSVLYAISKTYNKQEGK